ncbi:L-rhamnose mutarotase [Aerococcaceae bacterium zg-ZUI334]|uniref:L-rhamnose mutarotase n=1 Tax=Aerococcaceae TaxID=186827 RepID=UPI0013B8464B|nr:MULTISPECIES: L-rhamnose mutarotase [unclassified Facklamia]MBR7928030.1 L-rhamnose mutarotase [Aerococcaceae bacterium zg-ZUI334]NEW65080.1 L-rhamnose mutarotase [Facklamia sp. 252]NEW68684.1 L-rhamnose mutarotase [Facklamia sp. 253]QQD65478.1 L-rhamnose mutarotase [Aerococcaceae bacterium zg-252]
MQRLALVMKVYEDKYEEYKRRHDLIWPELVDELKKHGVHNYSIFLHESTGQLFAYLEVEDIKIYAQISKTDACKKWWAFMKDIMETNEDNSPQTQSLREVFYL